MRPKVLTPVTQKKHPNCVNTRDAFGCFPGHQMSNPADVRRHRADPIQSPTYRKKRLAHIAPKISRPVQPPSWTTWTGPTAEPVWGGLGVWAVVRGTRAWWWCLRAAIVVVVAATVVVVVAASVVPGAVTGTISGTIKSGHP